MPIRYHYRVQSTTIKSTKCDNEDIRNRIRSRIGEFWKQVSRTSDMVSNMVAYRTIHAIFCTANTHPVGTCALHLAIRVKVLHISILQWAFHCGISSGHWWWETAFFFSPALLLMVCTFDYTFWKNGRVLYQNRAVCKIAHWAPFLCKIWLWACQGSRLEESFYPCITKVRVPREWTGQVVLHLSY